MKINMRNEILIICLILMSSLVFANNGFMTENIEVKVTNIDYKTQTIEYVQNKIAVTLKLDPDIFRVGYYNSESNPISLKNMKLNKKYFLRIIHENYINDKNKKISESYVSTISTVVYEELSLIHI